MKLIAAVIRPSKLDDVIEALSAIGVSGFTVTEVKGFGRQEGHAEIYPGAEREVKSIPRVQIDTAVPDGLLDEAIQSVERAARTGKIGDGKIFVSALDRAVRVRTGETNETALGFVAGALR